MKLKTYCCKTGAMIILGLTHKQFQKLGLKPAEYMRNAWHPGWVHCFDQQFIESLVNDPKVLSLRSKGRAPGKAIDRYCNYICGQAKGNHQSATGDKAVEPDTAWIDELDWKERNDIEAQLADPLLDARMNPLWKDAIAGIWRRFSAIEKICRAGVANDEADFVLWMIDDLKSDMSMWSNNDPYQWMICNVNENGKHIQSDVYFSLADRRKYFEKVKGKDNA